MAEHPPGGGAPVRLRRSGWPVLRTPRWLLAGAVVLVAGLVLAAIPHRPSTAQRAADLRGFVHDMTTGIESCAGGVTESLTALHAIQAGTSHDLKTAIGIASYGVSNCSPANSMPLDDLVQYQVPESLAEFHLDAAVNDLVTWAFPLAQRVQADVARELGGHSASDRASAGTALRHDLAALDAQRATINKMIMSAARSLSARVTPPPLPG
ncbi:MAG TPA: hypothetical protein VGM53_05505 [Streptosporangiaceae bacterium]|jgi:hypothetical protein